MNTSTNPITPPGLIDDIRSLVATCGPGVNQNDKAIVAIVGCLMRAGFGNRHAGTVLNKNAGGAPNRHRWWRDAAGRYRVHTEEAALGV